MIEPEEVSRYRLPPNRHGYRNAFQTVGDLRAAAFGLAQALRDTPLERLAVEIHDSIACAMPCEAERTFPLTDEEQ